MAECCGVARSSLTLWTYGPPSVTGTCRRAGSTSSASARRGLSAELLSCFPITPPMGVPRRARLLVRAGRPLVPRPAQLGPPGGDAGRGHEAAKFDPALKARPFV